MIMLCINCKASLLKCWLCGIFSANTLLSPARLRVRDREGNIASQQRSFQLLHSPPRHAADNTIRHQLACVTSDSEKEDYIETLLGLAGSFSHNYRKIDLKNIIIYRPVFIFRKQVFLRSNRSPTFRSDIPSSPAGLWFR